MALSRGLALLREARWLTGRRAALYGGVLALVPAAYLAAIAARIYGPPHRPVEDIDFLSFYAASALALAGDPAGAWVVERHAAAQVALVQGGYFAFFYPPTYLLLCLPLALLPFTQAFTLWMIAGWGVVVAALSRWHAAPWPTVAAIALLAPAAVQNIANGQNGYVTTALIATAGLALDRRPWVAGFLFVALAVKPQLGLLVVPALVAARRWEVLGAGCIAGAALVGASVAALGWSPWRAFLEGLMMAGGALQSGSVPHWQMQSIYGALRAAGVGASAAWLVQGSATVVVTVLVVVALRRRPGGRAEVATVASGAPLVTPFILSYDLVFLLVPLAWLLAEARREDFLPWERVGLLAILVLPGASIAAGLAVQLSLGPIAPALALALVLRRLDAAKAATAA